MAKPPPLPESGVFATTGEYLAWVAAQRPQKYGAEPVVVEGIRFDSTGEAARWGELLLRERAGEITHLHRQVAYDLHAPSGATVGKLVLDFVYREGGALVFEDFKGYRTQLYRCKKRHFEAEYGPIRETGR